MTQPMKSFGDSPKRENLDTVRTMYLTKGDLNLQQLRLLNLSETTNSCLILAKDCLYNYINFHLVSNKKQIVEKGNIADILSHAEYYIPSVDISAAAYALRDYYKSDGGTELKVAIAVLGKVCENLRVFVTSQNMPGDLSILTSDLESVIEIYLSMGRHGRFDIVTAIDFIKEKYAL
jgi:hypothetical protein